ncbi:CotS family spore coat protein [Tumebacillus sp. ITR2]|uniref:CotS family spore coat protein n=1 Tax=Tumebacillus amylolyticus TaxID=2801339 RepID=A0ABS1JED7_9BACL|nr:CotS family spore coat protein [Tumebacillus amylolyticus]MBL0388641.1 CotS family spore coat protein [Tumebacillus amylolyticus]
MEEFALIEPWGEVEGPVPEVPAYLDDIAQHVMRQYDMQVSEMQLITTKPDKGGAIWRIVTDKGPRSLKVLHRTPARSLYSVGAQEYLVKQGARVPALIPNLQGQLYTETGGKLWIVTDWIDLTPASKVDLAGAEVLCYGLGEFHRHSIGYVPPQGAETASRLYSYPKHYHKIWSKMTWFRHIAEAYHDMPAAPRLLSMIDRYEKQALAALYHLEHHSPYRELIARGEPAWGIVHQDYGWSNGQEGPGGLWIIDLDGVSYDLPFRDLRKLISGTMDDMGVWDVTWIRGMIDAYHRANPIEPELYQMMLLDFAVPNEFYKNVKEVVFEPHIFMDEQFDALLQKIEQTEDSKWAALQELGLVLQTPPADYVPNPVFVGMNRPTAPLQPGMVAAFNSAWYQPQSPVTPPVSTEPSSPAPKVGEIADRKPKQKPEKKSDKKPDKKSQKEPSKKPDPKTAPSPAPNALQKLEKLNSEQLFASLSSPSNLLSKDETKQILVDMGIMPETAERALAKKNSLASTMISFSLLMKALNGKGKK